jgi:type I restriction enzyme S subunit
MKPQQTKFKQTEIGMIPEDWEVKKFEEITVKIIDGDRGINYPKQDEFKKEGFCLFLNTKNVPGDKFNFDDCDFVSKERDNLLRKGKLSREDIVLTTRGTVGNVALYDNDIKFENMRINSGMVIIRNDKNIFDSHFLYHLLRSPILRNQFSSIYTGSAQPQLPIRDINKINLVIPPLPEQIAISKILSSIDQKIALNQQMNKTLEAIGQAIFKHWFINFEFPNEKGKPYKSSGGEMVDSELGEIPVGWDVSQIGSKLNTVLGGTPDRTKEEYWLNGTIPWINSGKVNEFRITEPTEYITEEALNNSATKLLPERTTVIAITGATLGQVSLLEIESCTNQSVVGILESKGIPSEYIYFWIKKTIDKIISWQTGGAQQHINKDNINNSLVLISDSRIIEEYLKIINPFFNQITLNCFENLRLSQIRDSLLPKLMSGKIRVSVDKKNG